MTQTRVIAGTMVRSVGSFTDLSGTAINPDEVVVCYSFAGGTPVNLIYGTDAAVIRDSTGVFHVDIDTTASAPTATVNLVIEWASKATAPGDVQVIGAETIRVDPAPIVPVFA